MKKLVVALAIIVCFSLIMPSAALAAGGEADDAQTDFLIKLGVAVLVPLLIAWSVCSYWKSKMKTARIARTADNYIPNGGFTLTAQEDRFLYRTTTRRKISAPSSEKR